MLRYARERGITAAAMRYWTSRKTVYKMRKRYDGTLESLKDQPQRPHKSPKKREPGELKLVKRYARKYPDDPMLGFGTAR